MSVLCFTDICADGCSASADLVGNDGFSFFFKAFYQVDDGNGEIEGLSGEFVVSHRGTPIEIRG